MNPAEMSMEEYCSKMMSDSEMMKKFPDEKERYKKCCDQWRQGQGKQMTAEYDMSTNTYAELKEERKTYDISDVEIFSAGKWNGDEYSIDDLDAMVSSFKELGGKIKPYLKLGHDDKQKLLQKDGLPAAGWITGLKRAGNKLMATFSAVPEKVYQLIQSKAYGRFSSEIYWNLKDGQKKYSRVLKAVALLGADTPAVQTLDDFISLYTTDNIEAELMKSYHTLVEDNEMADMEKAYADQQAKIAELETQLKQYAEDVKKKDDELAQSKREVKAQQVNAFLDQHKEKFSPVQRELLYALAMQEGESEILHIYYEGDAKKEVNGTPFDLVKKIVEENHKMPEMGKAVSQYSEVVKSADGYDDQTELDMAAQKYAKEHNVSYGEALRVVGAGK